MKREKLLLPILLLVALISCDTDGVTNTEIEKLDNAIEMWQSKKAKNYSFIYDQQCFCAYFGKVEVVVYADTIFALKNPETEDDYTIETENGEEKLKDLYPELFVTIDELFATLKEATLKADEMDGSYDSQIGYPKHVSIDYYTDAVDDEVTYIISDYQVLNATDN